MEKKIAITIETAKAIYGKAKELDKEIEKAFPELAPKKWEDIKHIEGFTIDDKSRIIHVSRAASPSNKCIFAMYEQAEAALALAQLSQLIQLYPLQEIGEKNWTIKKDKDGIISKGYEYNEECFLSFYTEDERDQFYDENEDLIKKAALFL